ncbi:NnrS family protein [Rhodoplanes sp. TEM]|uniref:NnrS family protein n=1 Tax=Rhodoplanes tepidamans TaxID=200616 RepID=A0ABT5JG13_RHOTP|nr:MULTISPECIES: NnrS family protein [Rhodoplanes]MDC7788546.1 NnrS family protein [Rhodoplanes tepidamans]MDC7985145.1 NnrS family protein [Rhodoplanes sp. TEM]MDQ0353395.1 uncharacterized protein involved in response to NO [Rhodoplanes tepidamans]
MRPPGEQSRAGGVVLAYAFRPFFLLVPVAAVAAVLPLPVIWTGLVGAGTVGSAAWHAHEQVFGCLAAAMAGFALTAFPSWTGTPPVTGRRLAALVLVWLAGRIAFWLDGILPASLVALADLAFLPAVFGSALPALATATRRPVDLGLVMIGVLAANVWFHMTRLGAMPGTPDAAVVLGLDLMLVAIALALGRILPVTLGAALHETGQKGPPRLSPGRRHFAAATLVLFAIADTVAPRDPVTGWIALAAACAQLDRMVELHRGAALWRPQVLLFYLAQGFMAAGLAGLGAAGLGAPFDPTGLRHLLGMGAASLTVVTVMSVVSLRHTGRGFPLPRAVWIAPALIVAATVARVAVPEIAPEAMPMLGVVLPSALWAGGFLAWLAVFGPWLLAPRVDGKPG